MSFKSIKDYYLRLGKDEAFRHQIQKTKSKDEYIQILREAGYYFTEEEFAEYTSTSSILSLVSSVNS